MVVFIFSSIDYCVKYFLTVFFGITYSILIQADQRNYIPNILQIFTLIINTIISIILINLKFEIHIVKLASAIIYVIRPIILNIYVKKKYKISKSVT